MFSAYTGLVTLLALVALQSHALTLPPADGNLATTAAPLIPILLPVAQDPAESLDDIQIQCKGSSFGTRINYASCLDAFGTFKRGTDNRPITVGQRGSGAFMSLPRRLISDDGLCVFDIVKRGTGPPERTTGYEIARAAWKLMLECVRDRGGEGGVVSGIGQSGTLGVMIRKYDPSPVSCGSEAQTYGTNKCDNLLLGIRADVQPQYVWGAFGAAAAGRHVDEFIPTYYPLGMDYPDCLLLSTQTHASI
ncbi:MAG: hypothetical protein LQ346_003365 [Caloplaca aetnensis]|nr:MAG: hypothetical protein LQ346_003365 [Caloplaca aetnensis]